VWIPSNPSKVSKCVCSADSSRPAANANRRTALNQYQQQRADRCSHAFQRVRVLISEAIQEWCLVKDVRGLLNRSRYPPERRVVMLGKELRWKNGLSRYNIEKIYIIRIFSINDVIERREELSY